MSSPLIHFEIAGRDPAKLQEFFTGVFGWRIDADNPMNYGMVNLSDSVGGGVGPAPEGSDGHAMFYVGMDDVEAALRKAESLAARGSWARWTSRMGRSSATSRTPRATWSACSRACSPGTGSSAHA
jgi:predicted enzyme related to lactoylglutathione lyase